MNLGGPLFVLGLVATYVAGVIACMTIMPPLATWAACLVLAGFLAILGLVVGGWYMDLGVAVWAVATLIAAYGAFHAPHATTAGHWGYVALTFFMSVMVGVTCFTMVEALTDEDF